jgi:hypothetical protein
LSAVRSHDGRIGLANQNGVVVASWRAAETGWTGQRRIIDGNLHGYELLVASNSAVTNLRTLT